MGPVNGLSMWNSVRSLWLQHGAASMAPYRAVEKIGGVNRLSTTDADPKKVSERGPTPKMDRFECETCKNRKYQDGSDDPGVSYKTPTRIAPDAAASAVRGHEMEHVTREQSKARQEGRRVVSQSVTMHTDICPECGRVYVSGGTTRTVTKEQQDMASRFQVGMLENEPTIGRYFSAIA